MKKISLILFLLIILFIPACKDDETTSPPANNNGAFDLMKATVQDMMMEMDSMDMTMDPDYDFAAMMISHHGGAIKLADIIITESHHDSIKQMAQMMKDSQEMSRSMMMEYVQTHTPMPMSDSMHMMDQMNMAMTKMKDSLNAQMPHSDNDVDFASFMIPHHQGAIDMAQMVLQFGNDSVMVNEARKTIDEQQKEITDLKKFLQEH